MIVNHTNWPVLLAVAILGPLVGAALTWNISEMSLAGPSTEAQTSEARAARVDVRLPDGDEIALSELAPGRPTAVVVMKGPWCSVCRRQLSRLSERSAEIRARGGEVFGLTHAAPAKNRKLMRGLGLEFPILGDPSHEALKALGLWSDEQCRAVPGVVYLDASGTIAEIDRGRYPGRPQDASIIDTLKCLDD